MTALIRVALLCCPLLAACSTPIDAKEYGRQLVSDSTLSDISSNRFVCTDCHSFDKPDPAKEATATRRLAGFSLYDVTHRAGWWNGNVITLLDAINQCRHDFMKAREPLAPSDLKGRALLAYLESISPDQSQPLITFNTVTNITDVPSGDATLGKRLYDDSCSTCHGGAYIKPHPETKPPITVAEKREPGVTDQRIDVSSLVPDDTCSHFGLGLCRLGIIEKVRHGRYFGISGFMAPYALERLSDVELGHILAFLEGYAVPKYQPPAQP